MTLGSILLVVWLAGVAASTECYGGWCFFVAPDCRGLDNAQPASVHSQAENAIAARAAATTSLLGLGGYYFQDGGVGWEDGSDSDFTPTGFAPNSDGFLTCNQFGAWSVADFTQRHVYQFLCKEPMIATTQAATSTTPVATAAPTAAPTFIPTTTTTTGPSTTTVLTSMETTSTLNATETSSTTAALSTNVTSESLLSNGTVTTTEINATSVPVVTAAPNATFSPNVTATPNATIAPNVTSTPNATITPNITSAPNVTITPNVTISPNSTIAPNVTTTPNVTFSPNNTAAPNTTITPNVTATTNATAFPNVTLVPNATITPNVTITPARLMPLLSVLNGWQPRFIAFTVPEVVRFDGGVDVGEGVLIAFSPDSCQGIQNNMASVTYERAQYVFAVPYAVLEVTQGQQQQICVSLDAINWFPASAKATIVPFHTFEGFIMTRVHDTWRLPLPVASAPFVLTTALSRAYHFFPGKCSASQDEVVPIIAAKAILVQTSLPELCVRGSGIAVELMGPQEGALVVSSDAMVLPSGFLVSLRTSRPLKKLVVWPSNTSCTSSSTTSSLTVAEALDATTFLLQTPSAEWTLLCAQGDTTIVPVISNGSPVSLKAFTQGIPIARGLNQLLKLAPLVPRPTVTSGPSYDAYIRATVLIAADGSPLWMVSGGDDECLKGTRRASFRVDSGSIAFTQSSWSTLFPGLFSLCFSDSGVAKSLGVTLSVADMPQSITDPITSVDGNVVFSTQLSASSPLKWRAILGTDSSCSSSTKSFDLFQVGAVGVAKISGDATMFVCIMSGSAQFPAGSLQFSKTQQNLPTILLPTKPLQIIDIEAVCDQSAARSALIADRDDTLTIPALFVFNASLDFGGSIIPGLVVRPCMICPLVAFFPQGCVDAKLLDTKSTVTLPRFGGTLSGFPQREGSLYSLVNGSSCGAMPLKEVRSGPNATIRLFDWQLPSGDFTLCIQGRNARLPVSRVVVNGKEMLSSVSSVLQPERLVVTMSPIRVAIKGEFSPSSSLTLQLSNGSTCDVTVATFSIIVETTTTAFADIFVSQPIFPQNALVCVCDSKNTCQIFGSVPVFTPTLNTLSWFSSLPIANLRSTDLSYLVTDHFQDGSVPDVRRVLFEMKTDDPPCDSHGRSIVSIAPVLRTAIGAMVTLPPNAAGQGRMRTCVSASLTGSAFIPAKFEFIVGSVGLDDSDMMLRLWLSSPAIEADAISFVTRLLGNTTAMAATDASSVAVFIQSQVKNAATMAWYDFIVQSGALYGFTTRNTSVRIKAVALGFANGSLVASKGYTVAGSTPIPGPGASPTGPAGTASYIIFAVIALPVTVGIIWYAAFHKVAVPCEEPQREGSPTQTEMHSVERAPSVGVSSPVPKHPLQVKQEEMTAQLKAQYQDPLET